MKKKIIAMLMISACLFTACENNAISVAVNNITRKQRDPIKCEDVQWVVEPGLMDGERIISFNYTNNTEYVILNVTLEFEKKADVTNEQLAIFNDLIASGDITEQEVQELAINGYSQKLTEPGESAENGSCILIGAYEYVESMEQYNLVEPSMMRVTYLDGDDLYEVHYDYKTEKQEEPKVTLPVIRQWPTTGLAAELPAVEFGIPVTASEDEDYLSVNVYGSTLEEFDEYVEKCKSEGFTTEEYSSDGLYTATNAEGLKLDLYYMEDETNMSIRISKE